MPSCTSPKNNEVLKAAIFCNLRNQIKNESAEEIKLPFAMMPLQKKSCSESKLMKSNSAFSARVQLLSDSHSGFIEESEIECDEGSNVHAEFRKWSGNFISNAPSQKNKRILLP